MQKFEFELFSQIWQLPIVKSSLLFFKLLWMEQQSALWRISPKKCPTNIAVLLLEPEREREFSAERSKNGKREQSRKKRDCSRFFRD